MINIGAGRALAWHLSNSPIGTAALLHDWCGLVRGDGLPSPLDHIWSVRRDWPDGRHELTNPRRDEPAGRRALASDASYWRRGPIRPRLSLVPVTLAEFRSHAGSGGCRSAACPTGTGPAVPGVPA